MDVQAMQTATAAGEAEDVSGSVAGAGKGRPILELAVEREKELGTLVKAPPPLLDVEYVHDLRVLTRRVTETTRLFEGIVEKPVSVGIGESLRGLRQSAGELRDLDVMEEHLRKWRFPPVLKRVAVGMLAGVPERRKPLEENLRKVLGSASTEGMLFLQERMLGDAQGEGRGEETEARLEGALAKLTKRRRKQMEGAFGKAAVKQTDKALHEARIAIKKLRYALEIASAAKVKGTKQAVKALKGMQELLGTHHDVSVISEALGRQVEAETGKESTRTAAAKRKLRGAWRTWHRKMVREQARRAADFFMESYLWRNGDLRCAGETDVREEKKQRGKLKGGGGNGEGVKNAVEESGKDGGGPAAVGMRDGETV